MAYHPVTYGTLLDEIVRRATGHSIAWHVRRWIAEPLAVDVWMGLPAELVPRVVPGRWEPATAPSEPDPEPEPHPGPHPAPGSFAAVRPAYQAENPMLEPDFTNAGEVADHYAAERPAVGAITDARSLATMYAALLGPVNGLRLIEEPTRQLVTRPRTDDVETLVESGTTGPDIRFGLGYQLASPSMPGFGPSSFGHTGAGGRLGIADPEHGIGFGYVCSLMRDIGPDGDPRWKSLVDAVRACI
jgi:CubicO group peptidase (beta-lactamase class C family)